jgi:glycosyltransferase involved in cell wall biosynthesis
MPQSVCELLTLDRTQRNILQSMTPFVSIVMITYNHERYIAQAIESVLMQKVDFPIELIVGEDCSTDNTRELLLKYASLYPEVIRLILHERNVGAGSNFESVMAQCNGKYVAFLEGDDFWIDADKLNKQVKLLESDSEIHICFHPVLLVDRDNRSTGEIRPSREMWKSVWDIGKLIDGCFITTCSAVMPRRVIPNFSSDFKDILMRDWPMFILAAQSGKIAIIEEVMASYRIHAGGIWNGRTQVRQAEAELAMWRVVSRLLSGSFKCRIWMRRLECNAIRISQLENDQHWKRTQGMLQWLLCSYMAGTWDGRQFRYLLGLVFPNVVFVLQFFRRFLTCHHN